MLVVDPEFAVSRGGIYTIGYRCPACRALYIIMHDSTFQGGFITAWARMTQVEATTCCVDGMEGLKKSLLDG